MLAERLRLSATLTSRARGATRSVIRVALLGAVLATGLAAAGGGAARGEAVTFASPKAALDQGLNALRGRYLEIAIPALRFAAAHQDFFAQFLLATILSDNESAYTNHGEAYELFRAIVAAHGEINDEYDPRAPYVSSAYHSAAGYLRQGIAEIGLAPQPRMARAYFEHAAINFRNLDSQFEFAKMALAGEGGRQDVQGALHYFSTLTTEGHPGAQAFHAELLWRGHHVPRDEVRALVLAELAVRGARPNDQLWIDEIYQNIYCGLGDDRRQEAKPIVKVWERVFGTASRNRGRMSIGLTAERTCADKRPVPLLQELRGGLRSPPAPGTSSAIQLPAAVEPSVDAPRN